nr:unnamed protein product [Callosobruchus chinensis]
MKNDQVDPNDVYVKLMFQCYASNTLVSIAYFLIQMAILGGNASFPSYVPVWTPFYVVYIYEIFVVMTGLILPLVFSDLFFMTIIMLLRKQFKLLNEQVEKIFDCDNYALESSKLVGMNMRKCIRHHNFLLRLSLNVVRHFV